MADGNCFSCGFQNEPTFKFCPNCGLDLRQLICSKCSSPNRPDSKFCQECGFPFQHPARPSAKDQSTDGPPASEPPPKEGITIEFPHSTAQTFEFALDVARQFATFRQYGEDKRAIYRVTISPTDLHLAEELIEHMKGWRRRTVYVDGVKTTWDSVFSFHSCHSRRNASFRPDLYCFGYEKEYDFNLWGCIQAHLPFTEYSSWFCWGTWLNDKGDWKFDKERIRHELQKALFGFRFCPALRFELIEEVINALPDVVNPNKDKNWKFREVWGNESAPDGIVMTINRYGMDEKVLMKGVSLNGNGVLKDIAKRMKNKLPAAEIAK